MSAGTLEDIQWRELPEGGSLMQRVDRMIAPAMMEGRFGPSATMIVGGIQYHLGGERDTEELAQLASISADDRVLDVCCFLGGPALQLVTSHGCTVSGIDIAEGRVQAASRIAAVCGLESRVRYLVADAARLPFHGGEFSVIWSQCSLRHDESWLREFDRVLASGGQIAMTFAIRGDHPRGESPRWSLTDVRRLVESMGYTITHAGDITERDITLGWKALERRLSEREVELAAALGGEWILSARAEFAHEIAAMRAGVWGNGRIVAQKAHPVGR